MFGEKSLYEGVYNTAREAWIKSAVQNGATDQDACEAAFDRWWSERIQRELDRLREQVRESRAAAMIGADV